jgi:hypothetical protein
MITRTVIPLAVAALVTVTCLILWLATGSHAYTKFTVVERVEIEPDPDDPLSGTGFYDDDAGYTIETRDSFHFGLIPTPQGIFDKHMLSVVSIAVPVWVVAIVAVWFSRRRGERSPETENRKEPFSTPGMWEKP